MKHYTHRAKFYGIPCYFNEHTYDLDGINILFDIPVVFMKLFEIFSMPFIVNYTPWLNIEILEEL